METPSNGAAPIDPVPELSPGTTADLRPGPGLLASFGLLLVFFTSQLICAIGVARQGPIARIAVVAACNIVAAVTIAQWYYLGPGLLSSRTHSADLKHKFGWCRMSRLQVVLTILLVPPFILVDLAAAEWIWSAYRWAGVSRGWLEIPSLKDFGLATSKLGLVGAATIVLFAGILTAVGEETFFRGFLGRGLVARWGAVRGVLLTSVLFGLLHLHPIQSLTAAFGGIALHLLYLATRSLRAPMLLHALNNSVACMLSAFGAGVYRSLTRAGHLSGLLVAASLAVAVVIALLLFRTRTRWVVPDGAIWSPGYDTAEMPPESIGACATREVPGWRLRTAGVVLYLVFAGVLAGEFRE